MVEKLAGFCCFISYGSRGKSHRGKYYPSITDQDIDLIASVLEEYPQTQLCDNSYLKKAAKYR